MTEGINSCRLEVVGSDRPSDYSVRIYHKIPETLVTGICRVLEVMEAIRPEILANKPSFVYLKPGAEELVESYRLV